MANLILDSHYYESFVQYARLEDSTKKCYTSGLKEFGEFLRAYGYEGELNFDEFYCSDEDEGFEPIDLELVQDYVEYLKETKSESGLHNHLCSVKSFFRFLYHMDLINEDPFSKYPTSYHYSVLKNRALSTEEADELLKAAFKVDPFFKQIFTMVLFQFICGLRSRELCKLRLSQVNFDLGTVLINRGHKTFIGSVTLTKSLQKQLKSYINHPSFIQWLGNEKDKELFFWEGKPLNNVRLNKLISEVIKEADISRRVTSHDLRATMCYLMYTSGIPVEFIQRQMRHRKRWTTLSYLPLRNKLDPCL
jgi:integrase/recombinase XerD